MLDKQKVDLWNAKKFGLVLSGGGAKGAYQAGAFIAMYELDFTDKITVVSGTSAGALNALLFAMEDKLLYKKIWEEIGFRTVFSSRFNGYRPNLDELKKILLPESVDFEQLRRNPERYLAEIQNCMFSSEGIRNAITQNIDFKKLRAHRDYYVCAFDIDAVRPQYFNLKDLSDEEIVSAAVASSSIPFFFCPVTIRGRRYSDGGIDIISQGTPKSDNIPITPLRGYALDAVIVIHLNTGGKPDYSALGSIPVIDIYPSQPLESIKGTGTMDFTKPAMRERIALGYRDTMAILGPYIISQLKG